MPLPSVRLLATATRAMLDAHPHLVVYPSIVGPGKDTTGADIPAPVVDENGLLTKGYAVFHPGAGDAEADNLSRTPGRLLWNFQVNAVGSTHDQVGWVVDEVREFLDGQTLTVDGAKVGRLQPPLGFSAPPPRPDFGVAPPRLSVPLMYVVLTVA